MAIASLVLILGAPGHGREEFGAGAWSGVFPDKNNLGAAMSLGLLCSFALGLIASGWRRVAVFASMILCGVLVIGSHSTTALTSCAVALLVMVLFWVFRFSKIGSVGKFAVIAAVIAVVSTLAVTGISMDSIYKALGKDSSLTGRTDFWPYLYQAIGDRPILGYGYDAFFRSAEGASFLSYYIVEAGGWTPYHAHNSFIQVTLDAGFAGLALLVFTQIVGVVRGFMMALRSTSLASAWPLAIVVFLIFGSFTETYFDQYNTFEWIFFVAAVL
jgi:exopolysaccharide production protein ExoQ